LLSPVKTDPLTNDYGIKLISLCKSSGLRVFSGRHSDGLSSDYTYSGPRGMSVFDYLITKSSDFVIISKFIISIFTRFSEHAPLHIQFNCSSSTNRDESHSNNVSGEESEFFKRNNEFKDLCQNALLVNADIIQKSLRDINISSQEQMDLCVNNFTQTFF
jgi:hypothetical protein